MSNLRSGALVFFGATGDLAYSESNRLQSAQSLLAPTMSVIAVSA
jgi:hypothetical protein